MDVHNPEPALRYISFKNSNTPTSMEQLSSIVLYMDSIDYYNLNRYGPYSNPQNRNSLETCDLQGQIFLALQFSCKSL